MIGVGVVARDSAGRVVASMCSTQRYIMDSTIVEAYCARQAVEFGLFLGIQTIFLEGDALEITNSLNNSEDNVGKYGNFTADTL
jgi:hypothetical protein